MGSSGKVIEVAIPEKIIELKVPVPKKLIPLVKAKPGKGGR
jgi:hypothetical protein